MIDFEKLNNNFARDNDRYDNYPILTSTQPEVCGAKPENTSFFNFFRGI